MEEEKLLRILIIILVGFYTNITLANSSADSENWVTNLSEGARQIHLAKIQELMGEKGFDQNLRQNIIKPRPNLQIFVSSSMPKQILKNYAQEAKRYGGVLVLRGLPNGSIHKLTDLVMDISTDNSAAIQIDDTAYAKFEITSVPAIILSESKTIFTEDKSASARFDKITGSVTIKGALNLFANQGLMAKEARELLK